MSLLKTAEEIINGPRAAHYGDAKENRMEESFDLEGPRLRFTGEPKEEDPVEFLKRCKAALQGFKREAMYGPRQFTTEVFDEHGMPVGVLIADNPERMGADLIEDEAEIDCPLFKFIEEKLDSLEPKNTGAPNQEE